MPVVRVERGRPDGHRPDLGLAPPTRRPETLPLPRSADVAVSLGAPSSIAPSWTASLIGVSDHRLPGSQPRSRRTTTIASKDALGWPHCMRRGRRPSSTSSRRWPVELFHGGRPVGPRFLRCWLALMVEADQQRQRRRGSGLGADGDDDRRPGVRLHEAEQRRAPR